MPEPSAAKSQWWHRRYVVVATHAELGGLSYPSFRFWTRRQAESMAGHLTVLASCLHPTGATHPPATYKVRHV